MRRVKGFGDEDLRAADRQIRKLRHHAGKLGVPVHQQTVNGW